MPRIFVAISPPEEVRKGIERLNDGIARPVAERHGWRVSWVPPAQYHLTLKFLGQVGDDTLARLRSALAGRIAGLEPFELSIRGERIESFQGRGGATLHLPVEDRGARLPALVERIESLAETLGVARESRPFRPHLTLARVKSGRVPRTIEASAGPYGSAPLTWTARDIVVYESRTLPTGAVYSELERFALASPPA